MLGEFISKALVMILGYAYPALECFKTLEKKRVDMNDLRFWCQYWIIVALLSVCERFGDIFISWLPLYEELKLAFIIYLWYPKTKGSSYVYETLLRPLVAKHETDIERHLKDVRLRAWDLALYYCQNCTQLGQGAFFQVMDYMLTPSQSLNATAPARPVPQAKGASEAAPAPMPMEYLPSSSSRSSSLRPSAAPQSTLSPNADTVDREFEADEAHTEYVHVQDWANISPNACPKNKSTLGLLRLRLRLPPRNKP